MIRSPSLFDLEMLILGSEERGHFLEEGNGLTLFLDFV